MNQFQKAIVGDAISSDKKNFVWNMVGSAIFAASSMFLSLFMIKMLGEDIGGIFSIAITISQMMAFIAYYETRTFQVTDVNNSYSFGEYKATKLLLAFFMLIVCTIYVGISERGFGTKSIIILLMCLYRMVDGYADLYEGTFQNDGRLDLTGKSQAFRTVFSTAGLVITAIVTRNLMFAICVGIVLAFIGLWLFDVEIMKAFRQVNVSWNIKAVLGILADCFAMFAGAFLWTYILSAGRIAINANMEMNYQSFYQTLFMPISVINLCATFVMKPSLPQLAEYYGKGELRKFADSCLKIVTIILAFTVFCMLGAWLLGIPVLSFLSGCNLENYRGTLVFLMLAGGVNSLAYFAYYLLTVFRSKIGIFVGYVTTSILIAFLSDIMVKSSGIWGASLAFFVSVLFLLIVFVVFGIFKVKKDYLNR